MVLFWSSASGLKRKHVICCRFTVDLFLIIGPCFCYANNENHLRHGSMGTLQIMVVTLRNIFFLIARVGIITSALFIPVISQWSLFVQNHGIGGSTLLEKPSFFKDFNDNLRTVFKLSLMTSEETQKSCLLS